MIIPIKNLLLILCFTVLTRPVLATENIYWLNSWQHTCYQDNVNTCRKDWYLTPQGSHLLMWEVFQTIETTDSQDLFSAKASLSTYGFLYPNTDNNFPEQANYNGAYEEPVEHYLSADDMPLGFLKDKSDLNNRNYLGLSCAACHTGKITYGEHTYFVEAGQANADILHFVKALGDALEMNKTDPEKHQRFKSRFVHYVLANIDLSDRPINLLTAGHYLDEAISYVTGFTDRNHTLVENGPARLDAIGSILNQVHISHAGLSDEQASPLTAPVSFPYIWDVSTLECVQTNCISNNPLNRNVGEVLGVFGYSDIDENENIDNTAELVFKTLGLNTLFNATPKVDNMFKLERTLTNVSPPKWPSDFPPLNASLIAQGKDLYNEHCALCHINTTDGIDSSELTAPNSIGRQFTKVTRMHYEAIGTDPAFAIDYGTRKENSGILGTVIAIASPDSVDPETGIPFGETFPDTFNALVLLGADTNVIVKDHFDSLAYKITAKAAYPELSTADAVEALKIDYAAGHVDRNVLTPTSYRAKPLDGIAFTGPFLHNGSVRTLKDLLVLPAERAATFLTGTTNYDVNDGGYKNEGHFLLDTRLRGNGNMGHDYGTQLSSANKNALLEYLKSL